ncbi:hypothetical protein GF366_02535 [Candidatus Peregrinibacteria bacterium]|nr:hypothetical protein [Candidatus Peregrinibacteria bacterium]
MKRLLIVLSAIVLVFSATLPSLAFTDVSEDMFYYDAVNFLQDEGIVVGYGDGSFGYELNINRAELLKIVIEAKFFEEGTESLSSYSEMSCFEDVPANEWYTKYICYAKEQGWVVGYGDGTFRPAQNINFVEALKIVMEVFGIDYQETDPWYKGFVDEAASRNLIPLTIDEFGLIISRSEMADMITRMIMLNNDELDEYLDERTDYRVDYDSILNGENVSEDVPDESEAVEEDSDVLGMNCFAEFDTIAGVYDRFDCGDDVVEELDFVPAFQDLFPNENVYISNNEALLNEGVLYFTTNEETGAGTVNNRLIKYDISGGEGAVLYEEESVEGDMLVLVGTDLTDNLLIVEWQASDFAPSVCYSPWLSEDLYSIGLSGGESLAPYVPPQWKIDEGEAKVVDCL